MTRQLLQLNDFAPYFRDGVRERRFARFTRHRLFMRFASSSEATQALHAAIVHRWQERGWPLPTWKDFESFLAWLKDNWLELLKILLMLAPLFFKGVRTAD